MGEYEYVWYIIDSMWKRYECTIEWNENVKYGNENWWKWFEWWWNRVWNSEYCYE